MPIRQKKKIPYSLGTPKRARITPFTSPKKKTASDSNEHIFTTTASTRHTVNDGEKRRMMSAVDSRDLARPEVAL